LIHRVIRSNLTLLGFVSWNNVNTLLPGRERDFLLFNPDKKKLAEKANKLTYTRAGIARGRSGSLRLAKLAR
jgi:hypothetical protein